VKEVAEHTVSVRRLGDKRTSVTTLEDITATLAAEALPPDLAKKA